MLGMDAQRVLDDTFWMKVSTKLHGVILTESIQTTHSTILPFPKMSMLDNYLTI